MGWDAQNYLCNMSKMSLLHYQRANGLQTHSLLSYMRECVERRLTGFVFLPINCQQFYRSESRSSMYILIPYITIYLIPSHEFNSLICQVLSVLKIDFIMSP